MENRNQNLRMLVEGALMIALAYVLSLIKIWEMPNGGSITAGSMLPILIYAYRWGGKQGVFAGVVYGLIQFLLGPKWSFHPISILGDYLVAFGALGLVGFFTKKEDTLLKASLGIAAGVFFRWVAHVISGAIVFASYAPEGQNPWVYSMIYNASFLIPELAITVVLFALLYKPLKRIQ